MHRITILAALAVAVLGNSATASAAPSVRDRAAIASRDLAGKLRVDVAPDSVAWRVRACRVDRCRVAFAAVKSGGRCTGTMLLDAESFRVRRISCNSRAPATWRAKLFWPLNVADQTEL